MTLLVLMLSPLALAARLAGSVVDTLGEPVARTTVVAYDVRLNYATTRTATDGTWTLDGLPEGDYRLRAMPPDDDPRADGFFPDQWDFCASPTVSARDDAPIDGIGIVLNEGARITGRVVDLDGFPVVGATVLAAGDSVRTQYASRTTLTDAEGRFTIVGLDADDAGAPYLLAVDADGFPRQYLGPAYRSSDAERVEVAADAAVDIGTWALLDGVRLSGVVTSADGPVASGVVYAYATSQVVDTEILDGVWSVRGLPPGDVLFWAESDGLATTYYPGGDRPTVERFAMPEEGATRTDADLQLPVENALDLTLTGDGDLDEVSVLLYNSDGTVGRGAPVPADGRVRIGGLWPGAYRLAISGEDGGFVTDWLRDEDGDERWVQVDGETSLTATLAPGAGWTGRVTDERGEPVYGAGVVSVDVATEEVRGDASGSDGTFDLQGLAAGDYTLRATLTPYCPTDPGYTAVGWPAARDEALGETITLARGEVLDGTNLVMARDDDHDGMGDAWERAVGLDPSRDDGAGDPDEDGFTNVQEWRADTNPTVADAPADGCGCAGVGQPAGVPLAVLGSVLLGRRRPRRG